MAELSRTARFYRDNPEARKKHRATSKKAAAKPQAKKNRVETNRANRNDPKSKKGDKIDKSHKGGRLVNEHQSKNRARGGGKEKGKYCKKK